MVVADCASEIETTAKTEKFEHLPVAVRELGFDHVEGNFIGGPAMDPFGDSETRAVNAYGVVDVTWVWRRFQDVRPNRI